MNEQKTKNTLKTLLLQPTFMMCEPTHLDPAKENPDGSLPNKFSGEQIDREKLLSNGTASRIK